jgi:hypothetical protein
MNATTNTTTPALAGTFSFRRLGLLLWRDLVNGYRGVLIAMAAVAGFVVLISILTAAFGSPSAEFHLSFFTQILILGGFIFTSLAFGELHQNGRSIGYLTLPGSMLEKFLSKLITTSVGYAAGLLFFYSLVALASEGLNQLILGHHHALFNPVGRDVLLLVAVYLVTQSVYLAGSVFFRKAAFLKTVLAWTVVSIGLGIAVAVMVRFVFWDYFTGLGTPRPEIRIFFDRLSQSRFEAAALPTLRGLWAAARVLFWSAVAPVFWAVGYFRLRETEV